MEQSLKYKHRFIILSIIRWLQERHIKIPIGTKHTDINFNSSNKEQVPKIQTHLHFNNPLFCLNVGLMAGQLIK